MLKPILPLLPARFKPVFVMAAVTALCHSDPIWAVEPFKLKDIQIEGLQRTEAGTVFASLPFRVGDIYTDEKGSAGLRALFNTGLFKDIRIDIRGDVVVVVIEERPIISNVEFVGTKEFDKDMLVKALKDVGIGEGLPFDRALADRAEQEMKRQYLTRSLYGVQVVTTITPIERNRVNVTFTVYEGEVAHIKEIQIVGNRAFSEDKLLSELNLTTGGWLTWYTKSDRYSRAKLNADLETLRSFYLNRGFLEFDIVSTQVAISPDKQKISITITISEGRPYILTGVRLEGDYLGKDNAFKTLVTMQPGEPYRAEDVASTTRAMIDRFGSFGYAFAKIDFRPEVDRATGQVIGVFSASPQKRVYVRRINITGNSRTRDEVIRREFRQFESSWYDSRKIKLSRDRVDRLGYFKQVSIDPSEVPGTQDQVDLTVTVEERPTGNLSLGASYSSAERLALNASIKQDNIFGSGNYLGFDINTSRYNRTFVLSSVNPYFTDDGISRAFDVYYRTSRPLNTQGGDYSLVTPGFSLQFGVPINEFDTVFLGAGVENTKIKGTTGLPNAYLLYRERFGRTSYSAPLILAWQRDDRDNALAPNDGQYQRLHLEWGVGGDTRYLRTNYQYQHYWPITNRITFGFNGELGWGVGMQGRPYPIFKNFYGGGLGSLRGFSQGTLGPLDVTGAYIGGNRRLNLNGELYLPFPGVGNDKTLRIFGYMDAGNVWGPQQRWDFRNSIRASVGVGLSWISPVGPLKISFGTPIQRKREDKIERFQFQVGTAF